VKEEEEIEPLAPVAEAEEAPMPAWLEGEGLPSGDDALAWLEQLAEGKEEELQAQARAEAEVRMAEIMGRPAPAEVPAVEAPPAEAVVPPGEEAVAPPIEEAAAVMEEAALPSIPVEEPIAVTEEAVAPPIEEPVAVMEEAPTAEAIAPAVPAAELPPVEEAPPPEEIPAPEIALPTEEVHWGAAVETPPEAVVAPAPVTEEVPGIPEMEVPEEVEEVEEVTAPPEAPPVEVPPGPFAAERAYLKQHSRDYEAWLALARALWQADERQKALEAYSRVIRAGKLLDSVIPDLQGYVKQWPNVSTQRVLGDAYMKDGQLREALDIYRHALETL
jgi:tetratricopeptide (TPR) repeat protein